MTVGVLLLQNQTALGGRYAERQLEKSRVNRATRTQEAFANEYGADEIMIVTITYDHRARRRSYELIGEAFGLTHYQRTENT